jgi:hypothetical protein
VTKRIMTVDDSVSVRQMVSFTLKTRAMRRLRQATGRMPCPSLTARGST